MVKLIQLIDGTYKLVLEYKNNGFEVDNVWYFNEAERSDATDENVIFSFGKNTE